MALCKLFSGIKLIKNRPKVNTIKIRAVLKQKHTFGVWFIKKYQSIVMRIYEYMNFYFFI